MIILGVTGGLGNQMFIYAFYQSLIYNGIDAKMDLSCFNKHDIHNGYELEEIFRIKVDNAPIEEVMRLADIKEGLSHRILRRILNSKTQIFFDGHKAITYYPDVYKMEAVYLHGFWQSEKYFKPIENRIREAFVFPDKEIKESGALNDLEVTIASKANSVSIHIRRGDYLDTEKRGFVSVLRKIALGNSPRLNGVCTRKYYDNAIEYMESKTIKPYYYVFSDDIEWCKQNFILPKGRYTFVDINRKENNYWDMYLMSQCSHNIIANSSFSWWGAWLNSNKDKIVVAPDRWFEDGYSGDIVPEGWIIVSTI